MCIMKKSLGENWPYAPSSIKTLFRKEHINEMSNYNLNKMKMMSMDGLKKLGEECESLCKQDCQYSYYLYDISVINDWREKNMLISPRYDKTSVITIQHNRLPDLFISYVPETTFITFIGNFGGLLGMWLGISVITIFDDVFNLFKNLLMTIKSSHAKKKKLFVQPNIYLMNNLILNITNTNFTQFSNNL